MKSLDTNIKWFSNGIKYAEYNKEHIEIFIINTINILNRNILFNDNSLGCSPQRVYRGLSDIHRVSYTSRISLCFFRKRLDK